MNSKNNNNNNKTTMTNNTFPEIKEAKEANKPIFMVWTEDEAKLFTGLGYLVITVKKDQTKAAEIDFQNYCNALGMAIIRNKLEQPVIVAIDYKKEDISYKKSFKESYFICIGKPYEANARALFDMASDTQKSPLDLSEAIKREVDKATKDFYERKKEEYLKGFNNNMLEADMEAIQDDRATIPTGFPSLDKIINGGLKTGLYTIGAISSLGKTTFALQIANHIAEQGGDVLFYSLEQTALTLRRKNLSRHTYLEAMKADGNSDRAKTVDNLSRKENYGKWFKDEWQNAFHMEIVKRAEQVCYNYSGNMKIIDNVEQASIEKIQAEIEKYQKILGKTPVVFIDYLQVIPADPRLEARMKTESNIMGLKKLATLYSTPFVVISSINRDSYKKEISMDSFKESGLIEFSSDVSIGLQYHGTKSGNSDKAKAENDENFKKERIKDERATDVIILKQKLGKTNEAEPLVYTFNAPFNFFTEGKPDPNTVRVDMKEYNEEIRKKKESMKDDDDF